MLNCIVCHGKGGWYEGTIWIRCYCRDTIEAKGCLMDKFLKDQEKLHPNMRSAGAMLVCNCDKCRRQRGTL
jgi:hypothetical protein